MNSTLHCNAFHWECCLLMEGRHERYQGQPQPHFNESRATKKSHPFSSAGQEIKCVRCLVKPQKFVLSQRSFCEGRNATLTLYNQTCNCVSVFHPSIFSLVDHQFQGDGLFGLFSSRTFYSLKKKKLSVLSDGQTVMETMFLNNLKPSKSYL